MAKEREQRQRAARQAVQREERRTRQQGRKRLRRWLYLGASGVIAILITISLFLPSTLKGRNTGTDKSGGPGETFAILPATHIPTATTYDQYNSTPPTSGPHWDAPAPWGVVTTPVPNERQVHNLEHGGIVIQYKSEDAALISQLEKFAQKQVSYPCYLMVAPYPNMSSTITVTAWGVRETMETYDEAKLQSFVDAYRNRGPEQVGCNPGKP